MKTNKDHLGRIEEKKVQVEVQGRGLGFSGLLGNPQSISLRKNCYKVFLRFPRVVIVDTTFEFFLLSSRLDQKRALCTTETF